MRHYITTPVALVAVLAMVMGIGSAVAGPQARVGGTVVGTEGEPVVGATITITCEALLKYNKILETDDNGEFKVLISTPLTPISSP